MVGLLRRSWVWLALLLCLLAVVPSPACPFCSMQGQTLTGEVDQAAMVLFGRLGNVNRNPTADSPDGTTDLIIEAVIKPNDFLKGRKQVPLPRAINNPGDDYKFLVFCDVFKGKLDP